ncbi:glycosyltransferase family 2 protein [Microbacterium hydrocarbonoxydans]|uniref:glycosyltransferase family 2 protein n=1 Tax=Microbacterium hydrocarbonoxydans TaxID=273678 RepID=UPI0007BB0AA6|nr:glycosyltransferase family 2 protein [Microbacterium hydrocarbonoxydans]GAT71629.1 glycosyl transferase [Microbacterium sp. HM58-2]
MSIRVDVVLPCLNEAAALPGVLSALPEGARAIVVDNGSTDGSAEIAHRAGALVIDAPVRGYGAAVHAGLCAATAPVVAFCDADGSFDLGQLDRVTGPVQRGESDLVFGRRRVTRSSAWPVHARVANAALMAMVRERTGLGLRDLGPFRAGRREQLLALGLEDRRSGYPLELLLRAWRSGLRISETDVDYRPRLGRSKVTGTVRGTLTAVADMRRALRRFA